jgi:hypothetical protein
VITVIELAKPVETKDEILVDPAMEMATKFAAFETSTSEKFAAYETKFAEYETKLKKATKVIDELLKLSQLIVDAPSVEADNSVRTSNTFTTAANTDTVPVDSFLTGSYRSAKYQAQMTAGTNYQAIELLLIHDGTTANLVQYADVVTSTSLGTFDASITTGVLRLLFTPATATVTTIKIIRDTINV